MPASNLALAVGFAILVARQFRAGRLRTFLHALAGIYLALLALQMGSLALDPWAPDASGIARALRSSLLCSLLAPGLLFAFYVRSYNLLHLSLSFRTVRHFATGLMIVLAVILTGPLFDVQDLALLRRFMAGGLTLGLLLSALYGPLADRLRGRSRMARNLLGSGVSPRELDALMDRIQQPAHTEDRALVHAATELGAWLGTDATFLPSAIEQEELAPLWRYLGNTDAQLVRRIDAPGPIATLLARSRLHAAFALRIDGTLMAILGLPQTAIGGGYGDGQMEAVRLVMRQLASTIAVRRLAQSRIDEERRQEGQERLSMLGMVAASLAHEVKNPLSSIKVLAQALRADLADGRLAAEEGIIDLDHIVEQIDRLSLTTREILGLARPARDGVTDLTDLVRSTLYVLQAEARRRAVALEGEGVEAVGTVAGSAAAWQTVVFNLMLNAVEHTPNGAAVGVSLARRGDIVTFSTANPSPPMSKADLRRIFEPFVTDEGTGLGLPLVARRVRELGGRVHGHRRDDGNLYFEVAVTSPREPTANSLPGRDASASNDVPREETAP